MIPMRWLLRRLALGAAGLLLCLVAAEGVLRLWNPFGISYHLSVERFLDLEDGAVQPAEPPLPYVLRPGRVHDDAFVARINSLGMRGPEVSEHKPEGSFRLLFLGDSVAFGLGVDDGECFADRLRERLSRGAPVEVLNAGCPGYNGMHEAIWLQRFGLRLQPDLVLVVFIPDDPPRIFSDEDLVRREGHRRSFAYRFFESRFGEPLYLKQLLRHLYWVQLQTSNQLEEVFDVGGSGITEDSWSAYLSVLDEMGRMVEAQGARFGVIGTQHQTLLEEHCRMRGWPYLPGHDLPLASVPMSWRLSATDAHPNAEGHRVLADLILEHLLRLKLVPVR